MYRTTSGKSAHTNPSLSGPTVYSLYPAPTKPLPPLPNNKTPRLSGSESQSRSSMSTTRSSTTSHSQSHSHDVDLGPRPTRYSTTTRSVTSTRRSQLQLALWKSIVAEDKRTNNSVHYLDVSPTSSILASKHGNNIVKLWSLASGTLQNSIKFTSYTEARSRSRDYLIRSHAILSEASTLVAIATRFGRSIEIWDWTKKKCLQTISDADRWTASRVEVYDNAWCPMAVYHADTYSVDLLQASREAKKPLSKTRTIELKQAGLPFQPQYPELALSATSPLLVLAAGPRPPIAGQPPPERETLLAAWETSENGSNKPYRVARPWQHKELDTAIPSDLIAYGSVVVSIWIPASFKVVAVPPTRKGSGFNIVPVAVPHKIVLVWDLTANSTKTFAIPNCVSCISPDGRYVAYCDSTGSEIGARGTVSVLDVITGDEIWSWPDKDMGPTTGNDNWRQFEELTAVTELAFSGDGRFLIVGDGRGVMGVYGIRDRDD